MFDLPGANIRDLVELTRRWNVTPDQLLAGLPITMATLGDPLCDLGLLPVYALPTRGVAGVVSDGMGPHNGFPPMEELLERYAARTGLERIGNVVAPLVEAGRQALG